MTYQFSSIPIQVSQCVTMVLLGLLTTTSFKCGYSSSKKGHTVTHLHTEHHSISSKQQERWELFRVVIKVKLTSRSLTLYESFFFYPANADGTTQWAHCRSHTHTHTYTHAHTQVIASSHKFPPCAHTPHKCTPGGKRGVHGLREAKYLSEVAMGNRGREGGGDGGWVVGGCWGL